jgi:hypothetical protein
VSGVGRAIDELGFAFEVSFESLAHRQDPTHAAFGVEERDFFGIANS